MTRDYRIVVKVNNVVSETHDIVQSTWGKNTRDISAASIKEISERLIRENVSSFSIEFSYLGEENEQKETKENQRFDCC